MNYHYCYYDSSENKTYKYRVEYNDILQTNRVVICIDYKDIHGEVTSLISFRLDNDYNIIYKEEKRLLSKSAISHLERFVALSSFN